MEQYYQKAIEKDPNFALAFMGLGWVEMRAYWGSQAADQPGSRNYVGIKNPAVDAMIERVIFATFGSDADEAYEEAVQQLAGV